MKHHVFISHNVQDTGNTFTSHLTSALYKDGIDAISSKDASDDQVISETLLSNISDTLISVVVISKSYGASPRCLEELVRVVECMEKNGQHVLPIFHGVEPTHVRNQVGDFGIGFGKLVQSKEFMDRIPPWRSALIETANLSGQAIDDRSEAAVVDYIVKLIGQIIDKQPVLDDSGDKRLVDIAQVKKVESLLNRQSTGVLLVGIWGMGGIGKTTMAKRIFKRTSYQFDSVCYLNSKEIFGRDTLWREMSSQLLKSCDPKDLEPSTIERRLKRKKVLVVIDDVMPKYSYYLPFIYRPEKYFGLGSRIILTSRDKQLLKSTYNCKEEYIYHVQELPHVEALKLFESHAFKQQLPKKWQKKLSIEVVRYAKGLPLALIVLGCHLYDKNMEEWKSDLKKLENIPGNYKEVEEILKISFMGLEWHEQKIFLDIACAFCGWERSEVEKILEACGFYAISGIRSLLDKALLTISQHGRVEMHELLQQLGQNIVLLQCKDEPGKRSRLWRYIDFHTVMAENKGTEKVEVISVDLSKATICTDMKSGAFQNMLGLRVLDLHRNYGIKLHLPDGLESLPNKLVQLRWDYFPLASLPDNFCPTHLVALNLGHSDIKQLWSGRVDQPFLPSLKSMILNNCKHLIYLPDFSMLPNLQRIELEDCASLEEVPESIWHLSKLRYFSVNGCSNLSRASKLPRNLVHLKLRWTAIEELPLSIGYLPQLVVLILSCCSKLRSLPTSIGELDCLQYLELSRCSKLTSLPDTLANMKSLIQLHIFASGLESLPAGIKHLPNLKVLDVSYCKNLKCLPDIAPSLNVLNAEGCTSLTSVDNLFRAFLRWPVGFECSLMEYVSLDNNRIIRASAYNRCEFEGAARVTNSRQDKHRAELIFPGSELPEWVKFKGIGRELQMKLSEDKLEDFTRLAICLVASGGRAIFPITCYFHLVTGDRKHHFKAVCSRNLDTRNAWYSTHKHVFVWYEDVGSYYWPGNRALATPLMCSEATFEFVNQEPYNYHDFKVLGCGITPLRIGIETRGPPPLETGNHGE